MMSLTYTYEKQLELKGISLAELGLRERAFKRDDALYALSLLREEMTAVLGGDVYFRVDTKIKLAYANWYTNQKSEERDDEFFLRSLSEAARYIAGFPHSPDKEPLFSFVLRESNAK